MEAQFQSRVKSFLESRRIAVFGYSRTQASVANGLYKKFKDHGYEVFAVNPKAAEITEVQCYPSLAEIPGHIEAAMVCTPPGATMEVLQQCANLGVKKVWIHRSVDGGSYVPEADAFAVRNGLDLIPFGCPMMFLKPDIFHRCMRWFLDMRGRFKLPEEETMGSLS
jgi:predicted CoA-binding protein